MVKHVIMWKLKDEASGRTKFENAKMIKEKLEALVGVVSEIKSLEVGINIDCGDECAYDACLISEFDDFDALNRYKIHPEHKKVSEFIKDIRISRTAVDYEF